MPQEQFSRTLQLPADATVADALEQVRIMPGFDHLDLAESSVGVFGERCTRERVLKDGDRLEIYRPLITDPKTARRQRAGQHNRSR